MVPTSGQTVWCLQDLSKCEVKVLGLTLAWDFWTPKQHFSLRFWTAKHMRVPRPWSYRKLCNWCASRNGRIMGQKDQGLILWLSYSARRGKTQGSHPYCWKVFGFKPISSLTPPGVTVPLHLNAWSHASSVLSCLAVLFKWERWNPTPHDSLLFVLPSENFTTYCLVHFPGLWKNVTPIPDGPE